MILIFIILLIASIVSLVISLAMSKSGDLVVFSDYTDVAMTGVAAILPIIIIIIGSSKNSIILSILGVILLASGVYIVSKSTIVNNDSSAMSLLALFCKFTVIYLYIVVMLKPLISGKSRRKGESDRAWHARDSRSETVYNVAATGIFVGIMYALIKERRFSSVSEYLDRKSFEDDDGNNEEDEGEESFQIEEIPSNVVISCPNCNFNREVPRDKIPQNATRVTCPKCQTKFNIQP